MREVVTKVPARVRRSYECEVCKTRYRTPEVAKKCEARILEDKEFSIGDLVRVREPRFCSINHRKYFVRGKVAQVRGPQLPDIGHEIIWLGGERDRLDGHIYQYIVVFVCPYCKDRLY